MPAKYGPALTLFVTPRSVGCAVAVVTTVDELLIGFGSDVGDETVAVFVNPPGAVRLTTNENVEVAPEAKEAIVQLMVAPVVQLNDGPVS